MIILHFTDGTKKSFDAEKDELSFSHSGFLRIKNHDTTIFKANISDLRSVVMKTDQARLFIYKDTGEKR